MIYSEIDNSIKEIIIDDISIEIGNDCFYASFEDITKFSNDKDMFVYNIDSKDKFNSIEELYKEFNIK